MSESEDSEIRKVVVVDDEPVQAAGLSRLIEEAGYAVPGRAGSGAEAIRLVGLYNPDAVVMDVCMPGSPDSAEACRCIQGDWGVPVVMVSGFSEDEVLPALSVGAPYGFVSKPPTSSQLRLVLETVLRRRAEERLKLTEERLRTVLEYLPGVGFFARDHKGRLAWVNKYLRENFGWARDLPRDFQAVLADMMPDPDRREKLASFLEMSPGLYNELEIEVRDLKGRDRTFILSNHSGLHPLHGWSSWGVAMDITRRKTLEGELARRNELLQSAMKAGRMSAWEIDLETREFTHSRYLRELLHFGPDDPSNKVAEWHQRILPGYQEEATSALRRIRSSQSHESDREYPMRNGLGDIVWLRTTGRTLQTAKGRFYVGTSRDITERVRAGQMREDVERVIRHNLRSPLNGILGLVQVLLLEEMPANETGLIREVQTCAEGMLKLIDISLELHKLEEGRYTPPPKPVDLPEALRLAVRNAGVRAKARKVGLALELDVDETDSGGMVRGERVLIESMFSDLVMNAVEASPSEEVVGIVLAARDGRAVVSITNQGCVPESMRERFFEKYATYGKVQGTGLGTYSARLIARAHGGDVIMRTSDTDNATTLTVQLPSA